ncbi:DNA-methyltransferase [Helicobacter vulpis]|uniref:DNA-methyltransferase n=1 Tax=Helicobacter vulpis TaxID=2316076 RepID=UPI000EB2E813|nr:site-specific DNA-methyltransferase [Helicobacter vulpis]
MLKIDRILQGNCLELLPTLPSESVDLIIADPPYFMQTHGELLRDNGEVFEGVCAPWDRFESLQAYDDFCLAWLKECRRVLKAHGSIWVMGSFQNIYRLGYLMQNLGFWILNDIVWAKPNPVPNFRGRRFCNAHESLLWCAKDKHARYTFNYKTMKALNHNKQERSIWQIGICIGSERLKGTDGKKLHPTQKPQALLEKIILASSKPGDLILDPFFGTGTTGAVAKKFKRRFLGIEQNPLFVQEATQRIAKITPVTNPLIEASLEIKPPKVSLRELTLAGFLQEKQEFYDKQKNYICYLLENRLHDHQEALSIHQMAAKHLGKKNHNGWAYFYVFWEGDFVSIDVLRYAYARSCAPHS